MLDDAHHLLRRIARQTRVGVERDAVSDRGQPFEFADLGGEAGVDRAAEQAIEFLNLAAFPLPANPRVFRGFHCRSRWNRKKQSACSVPAFALRASTPAVRAFEQRRIARRIGRGRIGEVAQDREVDARVGIAQREHLDVFDQLIHAGGGGQHRGDDHHGPRGFRNAGREIESRQPCGVEATATASR